MAPVSYSFNAHKPKYHSKERNGSGRRVVIFVVLMLVFGAAIYFFGPGRAEKEKPPAVKKQYVPLAPTPQQFKSSPVLVADTKPTPKAAPKPVEKAAPAVQSFPKLETLLSEAEAAYAKGEYGKVRKYCYQILDSRKVPDHDPLWEKTTEVLGNANVKILFTDFPFPEKKASYQVKPNDGLRKIALDHNTSSEAVQRSNGMKLTDFNVWLGKTFNIYAGDWQIIISKSRRKLYLFDGKKLFKVYNVGIGKQGRTPTGIFKTGGKRKNPDWYSPNGKIPFGSKENVLGTRWIRLVPDGKTSRPVSGLGIHGTWNPDSIGKAESNGCLRLLNKDVEELFAILPDEGKSVPVKIIK